MRTYLQLGAAGFRRYSTYRMAIAAGVVTQSVFGFIRVSVLFAAISAAGGELAGYDQQQASTYVWLGQALLAPVAIFGWTELADRIKTGDIAVDLARPVDVQLSWWAADLGRALFQLLTRGLAPLLIGAITIGIAFPASWTAYPLGVLSVLLAVCLSFLVRFGVNLIAFWTIDVRGFIGLYLVIVAPFSGLYVPVHLFPDWLRTIAYATPFPSLLQFPIDVLSGRVLGVEALLVLAMQVGWLILLIAGTRLLNVASSPEAGGAGWLSSLPSSPTASCSGPGSAARPPTGPASG